ncbi:YitT family protein [Clostridium tagluense]|uniref:YitT family protein n=1 Tax=Clostridium tagluense TaxID=360422 RepID=UPI001C0BF806|nr:YitT family protein [Clostridium tagluense]MBU3129535.1 YitT family protein [Clostridium tagluense]MCB2300358.1 YitT family protein [Clostridium tagluense]MCB2310899.1 YitT family protein [Clostridium tagluense]MCB2315753.1 YitT family protein [Clostridium tagluense]MCB2320603.1 YitT family protein [Clostridium tagluense]
MKTKIKEFVLINIGMIMVSAGMYFFLMPNNLATGGANGLAIVINKFIGGLSVGWIMIIINLFLFVIAFIIIGKSFGGKSVYASFGVSGIIIVFQKFIPIKNPLTGDIFLELVFGILISGIGMAIVFNQNASTGGTDILAKILNKYFHINLGKGVLMCDLIITIMAAFAFGIKLSLYAMLGVIINGYVIDNIIDGINVCKEVTIISKNSHKIRKYIREDLEKTCTIYNGVGDFSNENKEVLVVILGRREFITLKKFINSVDKDAFITVNNIYEAFGDGFKSLTH